MDMKSSEPLDPKMQEHAMKVMESLREHVKVMLAKEGYRLDTQGTEHLVATYTLAASTIYTQDRMLIEFGQ